MPWEEIGDISTGSMPGDAGWIEWGQQFARSYISLVCGEPPPGAELGVMSHDHELGSYISLGVWYDYGAPWDYVHRCERALSAFDDAVDWCALTKHIETEWAADAEKVEAEDGEDDEDGDAEGDRGDDECK